MFKLFSLLAFLSILLSVPGWSAPASEEVTIPCALFGSFWTKPLMKASFLSHKTSKNNVGENKRHDYKSGNIRYLPAHLHASRFDVDKNYSVIVDNRTPKVFVCMPMDWTDRVTGCKPLSKQVALPPDFTIPPSHAGDTPNNPLSVYNHETGELTKFNGAVRPWPNGMLFAYPFNISHGGSGLSGGYITRQELLKTGIRHAIGLNLYGKWFLSPEGSGHVWPATLSDGTYKTTYGGSNPYLKMGSRLAIPPDVTPKQLGIATKAGVQVFKALQTYGAYVVDDSGWDSFHLQGTPGSAPLLQASQADMLKLFSALAVVVPAETR